MSDPFPLPARRRSRLWLAAPAFVAFVGGGFAADNVVSSWSACGDSLDAKAQRTYRSRNVRLLEEIAAATGTGVGGFVHRAYSEQDRMDPPAAGVTTLARVEVPGGLTPELFGPGRGAFVTDITDRLRVAGWDATALGTAASYAGRDRPGLSIWAVDGRRRGQDDHEQWVQFSFDPDEARGWVTVDHARNPNPPDCSDGFG